uniref:Uncharacterized protein n=1 Tax=Anabas testudineus TaxID=64144 RepID=A0A3Q1IPX5_ANATE
MSDLHRAEVKDSTGSPSSSAGLCRPARSPGKGGRSREPGALSYSNMCCRTEGRRRHTDKRKTTNFRHWCPKRTKQGNMRMCV